MGNTFKSAVVEIQKLHGLFQHNDRTGYIYLADGWITQIEMHNNINFYQSQPLEEYKDYSELITPHRRNAGDEECYSFFNNYGDVYNEHYASIALRIHNMFLNETK